MLGRPGTDPRHVFTRANGSRLYLGEFRSALDSGWLIRSNITAIVNATDNLQNAWEYIGLPTPSGIITMNYHRVPIEDSVEGAQKLAETHFQMLRRAVDWVYAQTQSGRNVLIHCKSGKNRSATVMIAFLIAHERRRGLGLDHYLRYVAQKARRRTDPTTRSPLVILSYDRGVSTSFRTGDAFKETLRGYEELLYPPLRPPTRRAGPRRGPSRKAKRPRTEPSGDSIFVF
jgi:hypothetical protein